MILEGKLYQIGEFKEGKDKPWKKLEFVIQTEGEYPKTVALTAWNDKIELVNSLRIGDKVSVEVEISSREYQGKWYTEVSARKIIVPESQETRYDQEFKDQVSPSIPNQEDLPF